jgi:hypothetical protein
MLFSHLNDAIDFVDFSCNVSLIVTHLVLLVFYFNLNFLIIILLLFHWPGRCLLNSCGSIISLFKLFEDLIHKCRNKNIRKYPLKLLLIDI